VNTFLFSNNNKQASFLWTRAYQMTLSSSFVYWTRHSRIFSRPNQFAFHQKWSGHGNLFGGGTSIYYNASRTLVYASRLKNLLRKNPGGVDLRTTVTQSKNNLNYNLKGNIKLKVFFLHNGVKCISI
jgi:hypothetical protein